MYKLAFGALFVGLVACGGGKGKTGVVLNDGGTTVDSGGDTCNILTQAGCNAGEKCSWIHDSDDPNNPLGHVGCAADGTVDLGGACTYGAAGATGYDDCKKGTVCIHGTCKTICDQNGGDPMCDANHSCQLYSAFLGPEGSEAAGVCDPLCNPLDDNDFDGSGTRLTKTGSACGSADGCYGVWSDTSKSHFSCAGPATDLHNRDACTSASGCETSGGNPYLNGCGAGYMPLFYDTTGSQTVVCSAFCKPADCSSGNCGGAGNPAPNRIGASPHQCNNTDAEGDYTNGDSCVYGWFFEEGSDGSVLKSDYSDTTGFCLPHSRYMLADSTGMAASTTPWPECETLPITATGSNCYGAGSAGSADLTGCSAVDFSCVSTTTGNVTTHLQHIQQIRAKLNAPRLPYHHLMRL